MDTSRIAQIRHTEWTDTVARARNLRDLLEMLVAIDEEFKNTELDGKYEEIGIDLSGLPVFGGPEPDDTEGVFSWDETNLLVAMVGYQNELGQEWEIIPRTERSGK